MHGIILIENSVDMHCTMVNIINMNTIENEEALYQSLIYLFHKCRNMFYIN